MGQQSEQGYEILGNILVKQCCKNCAKFAKWSEIRPFQDYIKDDYDGDLVLDLDFDNGDEITSERDKVVYYEEYTVPSRKRKRKPQKRGKRRRRRKKNNKKRKRIPYTHRNFQQFQDRFDSGEDDFEDNRDFFVYPNITTTTTVAPAPATTTIEEDLSKVSTSLSSSSRRYLFLLGVVPATLMSLYLLGHTPVQVLLIGAYIVTVYLFSAEGIDKIFRLIFYRKSKEPQFF